LHHRNAHNRAVVVHAVIGDPAPCHGRRSNAQGGGVTPKYLGGWPLPFTAFIIIIIIIIITDIIKVA